MAATHILTEQYVKYIDCPHVMKAIQDSELRMSTVIDEWGNILM
jgi:hypothetical protein